MEIRKGYIAPEVKVEGRLEELTLVPKHTNHKPDGFTFGSTVLTT